MKKIKNAICILLIFAFAFALSGCRKGFLPASPTDAPMADKTQTPDVAAGKNEAYLYVGRGEDYRSYKINYEENLSADMLIEKLAELTGWDLTLTKPVVSSESKMSIDFSKNSSVFTGRVKQEREPFEIDSKSELIYTILDSVAYTLKRNFVIHENPETVFEIAYSCEGKNIEVDGKKVDMLNKYEPDLVLEYPQERHIEFLTNRLSNYFDTPTTEYVKYGEEFDEGERLFIYRATDKNTGEVLGMFRFPSDLSELEIKETDGEFETIWEKEMFGD